MPKYASVKDAVKDFTSYTTFHGFRQIGEDTEYKSRRLAWVIIVLTFSTVFCYAIIHRILLYQSSPSSIELEVEYFPEIPFPAVTICNQNPYRMLTLYENGLYDVMVSTYKEEQFGTSVAASAVECVDTYMVSPVICTLPYDAAYTEEHINMSVASCKQVCSHLTPEKCSAFMFDDNDQSCTLTSYTGERKQWFTAQEKQQALDECKDTKVYFYRRLRCTDSSSMFCDFEDTQDSFFTSSCRFNLVTDGHVAEKWVKINSRNNTFNEDIGQYAEMSAVYRTPGVTAELISDYINTTDRCIQYHKWHEADIRIYTQNEELSKTILKENIAEDDSMMVKSMYWRVFCGILPNGLNRITIEGLDGTVHRNHYGNIRLDNVIIRECQQFGNNSIIYYNACDIIVECGRVIYPDTVVRDTGVKRDMRCDFQDNACGYRQLGDSTSQVWNNLYDVQIINQTQGNTLSMQLLPMSESTPVRGETPLLMSPIISVPFTQYLNLRDEGDSKRDWIDGAVCLPGGMSAMQAVVIQTEYYEEDGFAVDEIELSGEECQDGGTNGQEFRNDDVDLMCTFDENLCGFMYFSDHQDLRWKHIPKASAERIMQLHTEHLIATVKDCGQCYVLEEFASDPESLKNYGYTIFDREGVMEFDKEYSFPPNISVKWRLELPQGVSVQVNYTQVTITAGKWKINVDSITNQAHTYRTLFGGSDYIYQDDEIPASPEVFSGREIFITVDAQQVSKIKIYIQYQHIQTSDDVEYAVGMLYQGINATNMFTSRLISNVISTDTAKCISFEYMKVTTITVTRNDTDGTESTLFQDNVRTPHPTWIYHPVWMYMSFTLDAKPGGQTYVIIHGQKSGDSYAEYPLLIYNLLVVDGPCTTRALSSTRNCTFSDEEQCGLRDATNYIVKWVRDVMESATGELTEVMHFRSDVPLPQNTTGVLQSNYITRHQENFIWASVGFGLNMCVKLEAIDAENNNNSRHMCSSGGAKSRENIVLPLTNIGSEYKIRIITWREDPSVTTVMSAYVDDISFLESFTPTCDADEFSCASGECIHRQLTCDGVNSCLDASDEHNCSTCQDKAFKCDSGECIPLIHRCDQFRVQHCPDASDEINCSRNATLVCRSGEFRCNNGDACVAAEWTCDGMWNCTDGSDERGCYCGAGEFECYTGGCVDRVKRCNDIQECQDNSDETNHWCKQGSLFINDDTNRYTTQSVGATNLEKVTSFYIKESDMHNMLILGFDKEGKEFYQLVKNASLEVDSALLRCQWKGEPCNMRYITPLMTDMGYCMIFNGMQEGRDTLNITSTGLVNGLKLTMNVEEQENVEYIGSNSGIKIHLHDPKEFPIMQSMGYAVSPGSHSLFNLKYSTSTYLQPNYGSCGTVDLDYFADITYTTSHCILECETHKLADRCHCTMPYMPSDPDVDECSFEQYMQCVTNDTTQSSACLCVGACTKVEYDVQLSYSTLTVASIQALLGDTMGMVQGKYNETVNLQHRLRSGVHLKFLSVMSTILKDITALRNFRYSEPLYPVNQIRQAIDIITNLAQQDITILKSNQTFEYAKYPDFYNTILFQTNDLDAAYEHIDLIMKKYVISHLSKLQVVDTLLLGLYESSVKYIIETAARVGSVQEEQKRTSSVYDTLFSIEESLRQTYEEIINAFMHKDIHQNNYADVKNDLLSINFLKEPRIDPVALSVSYKYTDNQVNSLIGKHIKRYLSLNLQQNRYTQIAENLVSDLKNFLDKHINRNAKLENNLLTGLEEFQSMLEQFQLDTNFETTFIKNNLIQVDVYFEEMKKSTTVQNVGYTIGDFFSDLGGFMGLLLGASVITLFEILDIIIFSLLERKRKDETHIEDSPSNEKGIYNEEFASHQDESGGKTKPSISDIMDDEDGLQQSKAQIHTQSPE